MTDKEDFIADPEAGAEVEPVEETERPSKTPRFPTHPTTLEGYGDQVKKAMRQAMGLGDEEEGDEGEIETDSDQ